MQTILRGSSLLREMAMTEDTKDLLNDCGHTSKQVVMNLSAVILSLSIPSTLGGVFSKHLFKCFRF